MARFENNIQTDEEAFQALAADEQKQHEFHAAIRNAVEQFFVDKLEYTPHVIGNLTDSLVRMEFASHRA